MLIPGVTAKTGISQDALYKLWAKAVARGWKPDGGILKVEHVDDAPWSGRPLISTATAKFIIQTMTKNSTTWGWSCAYIASKVSSTPS